MFHDSREAPSWTPPQSWLTRTKKGSLNSGSWFLIAIGDAVQASWQHTETIPFSGNAFDLYKGEGAAWSMKSWRVLNYLKSAKYILEAQASQALLSVPLIPTRSILIQPDLYVRIRINIQVLPMRTIRPYKCTARCIARVCPGLSCSFCLCLANLDWSAHDAI